MNPGNAGAMLGGMLCALVVGVLIGTLIGAVFLRAGVALYNRFAGGRDAPDAVPEPAFGKAMGIMFVTMLVNGVVSFVLGLALGAGAVAADAHNMGGVNVVGQLISIPVSLLVMATMLTAMLPTTFGRGFLVTLCYMLVVLIVVVVLAVIFGGIALLFFALAGNH